jgi:hypothetical protein
MNAADAGPTPEGEMPEETPALAQVVPESMEPGPSEPPPPMPGYVRLMGLGCLLFGPLLAGINWLAVGFSIGKLQGLGIEGVAITLLESVIWMFAGIGGLLVLIGLGLLLAQRWARILAYLYLALAFVGTFAAAGLGGGAVAAAEIEWSQGAGYGGPYQTQVELIVAVPGMSIPFGIVLVVLLNLRGVRLWAARRHQLPGAVGPGGKPTTLSVAAVMSFVLSLMGCLLVNQLASVVLGIVALRNIRRSNGLLRGRGFAIAGVSVSSTLLLMAVTGIAIGAVGWYLNRPAAELAELRKLEAGGATVKRLIFLPDGRHVVALAQGGDLLTWRIDESAPVHRSHESFDSFDSLGLSGSSLSAVVRVQRNRDVYDTSYDRFVQRWDPISGSKQRAVKLEVGDRYDLRITAHPRGGGEFVVGREGREVLIWNARTGAQTSSIALPSEQEDSYYGSIDAICVSADARRAAIRHDGSLQLWDLQRGEALRRLETAEDHDLPAPIEFSASGDRVLGSTSYSAFVWDAGSGKQLATFSGHKWRLTAATLSADGVMAASGGCTASSADYIVIGGTRRDSGGVVYLWEAATGRERGYFYGPVSDVEALAFSPDGTRLAIAYANGDVIVVDANY